MSRLAALLAGALFTVSAAVDAAQRTFVSTAGSDSNPCSLAAPCRSFGQAIAATDSRGEVIVLDSGGYGRVTIDKSVTIEAPPGVYAGISVFGGDNGVDVATAGLGVALRGLTINGQGGQDGISISAASSVAIERCAISNMARHGVFAGVDGVELSIKDSSVHDNVANGVNLVGDIALRAERVRVERNGGHGFVVADGGGGSVDRSVIADNGALGIYFYTSVHDSAPQLVLARSELHRNAGGFVVGAAATATLRFEATGNLVSNHLSSGVGVGASNDGTTLATLRGNRIAHNGNVGVVVNSAGASIGFSGNVVVGNASYGLQQSGGGVFDSAGDNIVRDNNGGGAQRQGVFGVIAKI